MKKRIRLAAALTSLSLLAGSLPAANAYTIYEYSEGLAQAEESGRWGFAGGGGEIVIPIQYRSVASFSLGKAAVRTSSPSVHSRSQASTLPTSS